MWPMRNYFIIFWYFLKIPVLKQRTLIFCLIWWAEVLFWQSFFVLFSRNLRSCFITDPRWTCCSQKRTRWLFYSDSFLSAGRRRTAPKRNVLLFIFNFFYLCKDYQPTPSKHQPVNKKPANHHLIGRTLAPSPPPAHKLQRNRSDHFSVSATSFICE